MDAVRPSQYDIIRRKETLKLNKLQQQLNNDAYKKSLLFTNQITPDQYMGGDYEDNDDNAIRKNELLQANVNKLVKKNTTRAELLNLLMDEGLDDEDGIGVYFNSNFPKIFSEITKNFAGLKSAKDIFNYIVTMKGDNENEAFKNPLSAHTFKAEISSILTALDKTNNSKASEDIKLKLEALDATMKSIPKGMSDEMMQQLQDVGITDAILELSQNMANGQPISSNSIPMQSGTLSGIVQSLSPTPPPVQSSSSSSSTPMQVSTPIQTPARIPSPPATAFQQGTPPPPPIINGLSYDDIKQLHKDEYDIVSKMKGYKQSMANLHKYYDVKTDPTIKDHPDYQRDFADIFNNYRDEALNNGVLPLAPATAPATPIVPKTRAQQKEAKRKELEAKAEANRLLKEQLAKDKAEKADKKRRDAIKIPDEWDCGHYIHYKTAYKNWCRAKQGRSVAVLDRDLCIDAKGNILTDQSGKKITKVDYYFALEKEKYPRPPDDPK